VTTHVAVVGAGIGGLTTALALAAGGRDVTILERRVGFPEIGAGIQLSPNASRVLIELGLGAALRRAASEPKRVVIRAVRSGRMVGEVALGAYLRARYAAPYFVVHRADLQTILLDAVRSRPNIRLLMGRKVVAVENRPEAAALTVEKDGGGDPLLADLVIGADGVRSRVRRALGDTRAPAYRGYAAWRSTLPRDSAPVELAEEETGLWLGSEGHVVHYR
jgi:salicylate hydroxylase